MSGYRTLQNEEKNVPDHEIYGVIRSRCSNTGAPGSRGSKKIEETRYLENIRKWHKDCWWRHEKWRDGKKNCLLWHGWSKRR